MKRKGGKRNQKNVHHIIGKSRSNRFNTDIPQNKIIVDMAKHEALNTLVGNNQSPKEQLSVLYNDRWITMLSEETKTRILELLNTPDKDFYIKEALG